MSKWYEFEVQTFKTVLVEIEDSQSEKEARDYLESVFSLTDNAEIIKAELIPNERVAAHKRHADEVFKL